MQRKVKKQKYSRRENYLWNSFFPVNDNYLNQIHVQCAVQAIVGLKIQNIVFRLSNKLLIINKLSLDKIIEVTTSDWLDSPTFAVSESIWNINESEWNLCFNLTRLINDRWPNRNVGSSASCWHLCNHVFTFYDCTV